MCNWLSRVIAVAALVCLSASAIAQPSSVEHAPLSGLPTTNLNPANPFAGATNQRNPASPREDEAVRVLFRVSFQFAYDNVAVYYTTDGSEPSGSFGTGTGTTQVLRNSASTVTFVANENSGGTRDWWTATIPVAGRTYGQLIKYKVSAWKAFTGGEVFANGGGSYSYTVKLAWPGQGSAFPGNEGIGYPPVWPYKEEGVVGNNFINAMLDQNGNVFDVYYPGAGGVQGVGTKNEGYTNGLDTFPPGLPVDNRGQMHLNQILTGIRAGGITSWLSNQNGTDFTGVTQRYEPDTQTIRTQSTFVRGGRDISITQYDFSPKGVASPNNGSKGIVLKRMVLKNNLPSAETVNVYMYMDPALNGGDAYDFMLVDSSTGAMIAGDNTYRIASNTGSIGFGQEYNITTFSGYEKNVSLFLAGAMKVAPAAGGTGGTTSSDSWRDSSGDNGQGWIGQKVTLPANTEVEVDFIIVGGFERPAGRDAFPGINGPGVYNTQMLSVVQWFQAGNLALWQNQTDAYWQNFLGQGVSVELPDARLQTLFNRGLLGTMLHFDEAKGGLIAGFRNGAYPYVWPRDMAWAAVTLSRTGHTDIVSSMTRFLRDTTFRDFETWTPGNTPGFAAAGGAPFYGTRKGFWKQKYTTDGYTVWGAPQVDETAVFPWMVYYNYLVTGDINYLTEAEAGNPANTTYAVVRDAVIAMSQTSTIDGTRLNHRASYPGSASFLMYSNNVWEDQYDTFLMSNANIYRGLRDAASIANVLALPADAADSTARANGIQAGLLDKLNWNGENTDASLLGVVYPFNAVSPTHPGAVKIIDRINGVAQDRFGQTKPLVRFAGQYNNDASDYVGLIDRYYGDGYWGNSALGPTKGGPWFLTTLWYGAYYAMRQDYTPGTGDIDNHLYRLNRAADFNGPIGFGAEQMAPINSRQYPNFRLQTAWPNAWESMSFYVDAVMLFLDYTPDAPGNTLRVKPKLPAAWPSMKFNNLEVGSKTIDVLVERTAYGPVHTFTNDSGLPVNFETTLRIDAGVSPCRVLVNGVAVTPAALDTITGSVRVTGALDTGVAAVTVVSVVSRSPADLTSQGATYDNGAFDLPPDGALSFEDFVGFLAAFTDATGCPGTAPCNPADICGAGATYGNGTVDIGPDGELSIEDFIVFLSAFSDDCGN